ncbi:MAG TPA: DUF5715 family protein [Methylomirabilota bacterium]|jgi:hypothetical protein|nr:DUF5715 family protein [Methylomirabilota bacterium]
MRCVLLIALVVSVAVVPVAWTAHVAEACAGVADAATPLRARRDNLVRENTVADRQRLSRLRALVVVRRFVRARLLVPLPARTNVYRVAGVDPALRVTRPWTKRFVEQLGRGFHGRFGAPLKITSLTRTAATQRALRRVNTNAAAAHGRLRSTHLTGAAVDISTRPLGQREVRWLRVVLRRLAAQRVLSAIEEVAQPHFHVLVFRRYGREGREHVRGVLESPC